MNVGAASRQAKLAASASLARKGRINDAEMVLADLAADMPGDIEVLAAMGALALGRGDSARGKTIFGEILRVAPDRADILASLAQAYRLENDIAAAATCLRRAVDCGRDARHRAALAELLLLQNEPLQAQAEIGLALRECPDDFGIRMVAGLAAIAVGDAESATEHFSYAHGLAPDEAAPLNNLAELAARAGDNAQALDHAEAAYLIEPADPDLALGFAARLRVAGATTKANAVIQRALAIQPQHFGLVRLKAEMRLATGETQGAITDLAAFVSKNRRPETIRALAGLLRQAGRLEQAKALLVEALQKDPADPAMATDAIELALCTGDIAAARTLGFRARGDLDAFHVDHATMAEHSAGEILLLAQILAAAQEGSSVPVFADGDVSCLLRLVPGLELRPLSERPQSSLPLPGILPLVLGRETHPFPLRRSLVVNGGRKDAWKRALEEHPRPAIGLLWSENSAGLSLADLAGALDGMGTLVSLAVGDERSRLATFPHILDAGAHISGPDDLAAAIEQLDLIVSVNALAISLAGGLDRPAIALIAQSGTWSWAQKHGISCWAPSVTVVPVGASLPTATLLTEAARGRLSAQPDHLDRNV